jgi:glutathione S-transferase
MYTLYDYWESGNCYKVRLLLNQVEIAYQRILVDICLGRPERQNFGKERQSPCATAHYLIR